MSPNPNSTADNIRKKKVKDNKFTLSKIKPTTKTIIYSDIHNNSAVNNKCNAVFMFSTIVKKKMKNIINIRFISPNIIFFKKKF